jgi:prevent-host-death family protein
MSMESVGILEAKTHFSKLLERVERGETIQITKRGQPVAVLAPSAEASARDLKQVTAEIRRLRKGNKLGPGLTIRQLIDEGRRF